MTADLAKRQCKNCNLHLDEGYQFCPKCSQRVDDEQDSLGGILKHFLSDYFTFDSKITKSVWPLLSAPGKLTEEFVKGRRVRYIPPLRMYVFISLFFFLILGWNSGSGGPIDSATMADDHFFSKLLPRLFFFLLPLFAMFLSWLFKKKKAGIIYHLVFSLHYHAFVFLSLLFYLALSKVFTWLDLSHINAWIFGLFSVGFVCYLYIALRRVYAFSHGKTTLRFFALLLLYSLVLIVTSVVALGVETLMQAS